MYYSGSGVTQSFQKAYTLYKVSNTTPMIYLLLNYCVFFFSSPIVLRSVRRTLFPKLLTSLVRWKMAIIRTVCEDVMSVQATCIAMAKE